MQARRLFDPTEFLAAATPLLLRDEARNNLILGLGGVLRDRPGYYPEFHLWLVENGNEIVGAALQTPPYKLVLAQPSDDLATVGLADAIADEPIDLPGVVGAPPEVDRFAEAWEARRDTARSLRRSQRIYRVSAVRSPRGVNGSPRAATTDDTDLLVDWITAFTEEALPDTPASAGDTARMIDARLADANSGFLIWEDQDPVSVAGWGGPTPTGIRIGPVYTPPDRRSRGYGSAVSAAVSSARLAEGRRFCFLYTDLANPTSNKIYMDIGYEPVCDALEYAFEPNK
jgi:GNAT superfamily N-acetyltransferase